MSTEQIPVTSFEPPANIVEQVLSYPYERPRGSYFTNGDMVTLLSDDPTLFKQRANALLAAQNLPSLEQRIPVIAYGSNMSPAEFKVKMAKYPETTDDKLMQAAPMLAAKIPDTEVVWHGKLSSKGGLFADIYNGQLAKGKTSNVLIEYLTKEQLLILHVSEGTNYTFTRKTVELADGTTAQAFLYQPHETTYLEKGGHPIPVAGIVDAASAKVPPMTASEAMAYILEQVGDIAGAKTPEEFVQNNKDLPLKPRQERRRQVAQKLAALNVSVDHDAKVPYSIGRVDFNDLTHPDLTPHIVQLPEMLFKTMRPGRERLEEEAEVVKTEKLKKGEEITYEETIYWAMVRLDPVFKLRNRWMTEIAARNKVTLYEREFNNPDDPHAFKVKPPSVLL